MFMKKVVSTRKAGPILLALTLGLTACGGEKLAPAGDGAVDPDIEAIPELGMNLSAFPGTCLMTSATVLTMTFTGAGTGILSMRVLDKAIMVNGIPCTGFGAAPIALQGAVKQIVVAGTAAAETLIVDFAGGSFGLGTTSLVGMTVDLAGGANEFKFRGQSTPETITMGAGAIATPYPTISYGSANKDIVVTTTSGVPVMTLALSGGADVFNAGGSTATGAELTDDVIVYGGLANDTFLKGNGTGSPGALTAWGGAGTDTFSYAARTSALDVVTVTVDGTHLSGGGTVTSGSAAEGDLINTDIETVIGTSGNDTFNVTQLPDPAGGTIYPALTLNGGPGNDSFVESNVATSKTVFIGGTGTNTVDYSARTQAGNALTIIMGTGAADGEAASGVSGLTGGEQDDVQATIQAVVGTSGDDSITGSAAADTISGGPGVDTLIGLAGNDTLNGGAGNDILNGGDGDDSFPMTAAADGTDTVSGGNGVDTVDYSLRSANNTCDLTSTATVPSATLSGASGENDEIRDDVENCLGAAGATVTNLFNGNGSNNEFVGGAGVNTFNGGAGDDTMQGGVAADQFYCGAGDDITISGGGTDVFHTPAGAVAASKSVSDCEL